MKIEIIGFEEGYHAHLSIVKLLSRYCGIRAGEAWKLSSENIHEGKRYKVKIPDQSDADLFIEGLKKNHVIYKVVE